MKESEPIDLSKVIIARKWSYIEWNMHHRNLTLEEFIKHQQSLGIKTDAMVESHFEQLMSLETILDMFENKPRVLAGETLTKKLLEPASWVISLGGDDHYKYVSHFVDSQPILALNSDYTRSEGGMIFYLPQDLRELLPKLEKGKYKIEEWSRLQAIIEKPNKKPIIPRQTAISEIYIGTWARISMSKYIFDNLNERHKDSGALVVLPVGVGDGSWFNAAGGNIQFDHRNIPRFEKKAWYLATEQWEGRILKSATKIKEFCPGEKIEIHYTSYYDGTLSIDPKEGSGRNYLLKMGDRVTIEFSGRPLRVITSNFF